MIGFFRRRIGFRSSNEFTYRIYNVSLAALLLFLILPLIVLISCALLATQGQTIFYRGPRLGKDQKVFHILKFRTLCTVRARELTRYRTLPAGSNIETPLGGLLRESRLDELPQLFNILTGDMNFCGPRPVRVEIAEIERDRIHNYDLRFTVKPGLVGPTQAYFGHGTSKRVRARMNNILVMRPVSITAEMQLNLRIAFSMLKKIGRKLTRLAFGRGNTVSRIKRPDIWLASEDGTRLSAVQLIGLRKITARGLLGKPSGERAVLYIRLRSGALRKARLLLSEPEQAGTFDYTAETAFGEFIIERYALGLVVVPPQLAVVPAEQDRISSMRKAYT